MAAAVAPNAESVLRPPFWHVLHGNADALPSSVFERSGCPARERSPRRRRVDDYQGSPDLDGQYGASHESLLGVQPPDASVQGRMQGEDGNAVLLNEVVEIGVLDGVPALVHHDLDAVVPCLGRPAVGAI